jgi:2-keto-4-pentenoate hydratase/2-oxohepta-3-ene-1,7-dioic acid hydratase in catechol pathway
LLSPQVDPTNLRIQTLLNGEVVQDSNTADMTFGVAQLVSFLSQGMTLLPGTVILTGTPSVRVALPLLVSPVLLLTTR